MQDLTPLYEALTGQIQTMQANAGKRQPWQEELLESVNPEKAKREKLRAVLRSAGQSLATTPGNFLTGLASASGAGANAMNQYETGFEQQRLNAMKLLADQDQSAQNQQLQLAQSALGVGQSMNNDQRTQEAHDASLRGKPMRPIITEADGRRIALDPVTGQVKDLGAATSSKGKSGLSSAAQKAILEDTDKLTSMDLAEDALTQAMKLNDKAFSGMFAETGAFMARNDPFGVMDQGRGQATTQMTNLIMNQALSQMKAIFGGNPTEGERDVLLRLQASVDKHPDERKAILQEALQMLTMRKRATKEKITAVKSGALFEPEADGTVTPDDPSGGAEPGYDLDADQIPEGATVEGDDGQTYTKQNGELIPVE